jgi:hypothetical protein
MMCLIGWRFTWRPMWMSIACWGSRGKNALLFWKKEAGGCWVAAALLPTWRLN